MTDIEYSSGPDKVPLHFYISQNSTTHNNYNRIYEREKPKCPCRKYYHGDDCLHCKKGTYNEEDSLGYLHSLVKNAPKHDDKTGFSHNKNPYVVYDKNIDENDFFRDDFHWLTTHNDKYRPPKYKDKGSNIQIIVEDGYTRGIKNLWDPSLHTKDDNISVMKKDYVRKYYNDKLYPEDQIQNTESGYCTNTCKIHTYKDLADYVENDYDFMDRDRKIDPYYKRNVFPTYIEDDGFTRKGAIKSYLDLAPKFEEDINKKDHLKLPTIDNENQKPFEQFKTITHTDYIYTPSDVYDRLKMNIDKSRANSSLYSGLTYLPTKSDPEDFITESMDKFRDNKESKKVEEQLKHPIVCDYMFDDGYTKGNRNSRGLISNNASKCNHSETCESHGNECLCRFSSRLYCKRHLGMTFDDFPPVNGTFVSKYKEVNGLPVDPQHCKPDTSILDYVRKTKK